MLERLRIPTAPRLQLTLQKIVVQIALFCATLVLLVGGQHAVNALRASAFIEAVCWHDSLRHPDTQRWVEETPGLTQAQWFTDTETLKKNLPEAWIDELSRHLEPTDWPPLALLRINTADWPNAKLRLEEKQLILHITASTTPSTSRTMWIVGSMTALCCYWALLCYALRDVLAHLRPVLALFSLWGDSDKNLHYYAIQQTIPVTAFSPLGALLAYPLLSRLSTAYSAGIDSLVTSLWLLFFIFSCNIYLIRPLTRQRLQRHIP